MIFKVLIRFSRSLIFQARLFLYPVIHFTDITEQHRQLCSLEWILHNQSVFFSYAIYNEIHMGT